MDNAGSGFSFIQPEYIFLGNSGCGFADAENLVLRYKKQDASALANTEALKRFFKLLWFLVPSLELT